MFDLYLVAATVSGTISLKPECGIKQIDDHAIIKWYHARGNCRFILIYASGKRGDAVWNHSLQKQTGSAKGSVSDRPLKSVFFETLNLCVSVCVVRTSALTKPLAGANGISAHN